MKQLAQFCSAGPVTAFVAALALCASLSGPCRADFKIVAAGTPQEIKNNQSSVTGKYL